MKGTPDYSRLERIYSERPSLNIVKSEIIEIYFTKGKHDKSNLKYMENKRMYKRKIVVVDISPDVGFST